MMAITEQFFPLRKESLLGQKTTSLEIMRRRIEDLIRISNNWKDRQIKFDGFNIRRLENIQLGGEKSNIPPLVMFQLTRPDGFVFDFGSIFEAADDYIDVKRGDIAAVLAVAATLPREFCESVLESGQGQVAIVTRPPWQTEDKFPRPVTHITFSKAIVEGVNCLLATRYENVIAESAFDKNIDGPQHLIVNSGVPMFKQANLRK